MTQKRKKPPQWLMVLLGIFALAGVSVLLVYWVVWPVLRGTPPTAQTHDIESVMDYKNPYVGNASNTANLFYRLPLNELNMKFEIDDEACALKVTYVYDPAKDTDGVLRPSMVYNATASMALIDNLTAVTFAFSDGSSHTFTRTQLEQLWKTELSSLLEPALWEQTVQQSLQDASFVDQFYQ